MSNALAFILFFLVANPMTYSVTGSLPVLGPLITDNSGMPTQVGVMVHALVFVLLMLLVARLMKK
jgi:hypothetical protein